MKKNLLGISLITMSCLYGLLAAIIILIFIITGLPAIGGIIISGIVLLIQFLISPYLTDLTLKWFYKADFNAEVPEYLKNFINEVCKKYDMKYPKIAIIEDGAPNAFTYGRTKNDARVVVTRGIFNLLNEQEVIAVVAHELGHAEHYDMAFMTVAQLVPLVLYGIYEAFTRPSKNRSNNKNGGYLEMIGLIAYILYLISEYIVLWLSRTREYYADSFSIEETKNPNALETALIKIGYGLSINNSEQETKKKNHTISNSKIIGIFDTKTSKSLVATSYNNGIISTENIKNAMKWETWNVWAILYELKSTHPLISKRLKAIGERCAEFNQQPFVKFDLKKPE
jgi:Zn-dependent protease with chaperone function